ncbi:PDZ domain-containing protein [Aggregatimonas sangjinii]|uniref:PDZ domain-containing protein n=1 Tax=Aggregatimonas sangjinii TaxID=2583587 RepID=A0A5B7SRA1_9FLAO|nr:PDZ domain-containing protein [Aggregatimonas sangjinii]QCW99163.1 PDZ domain-containing protein [Aggregatimonas sangjinii]
MRNLAVLFSLLMVPIFGMAQHYELPKHKKYEKVKFKLVNNLMVVPMTVNGTELSFILDSGVSTPILFNLSDQDSLQINKVAEITINGLGEGEPIKALTSRENRFQMGEIRNPNQPLYVVLDRDKNFSPDIGIPVHGMIGFDLFRDFVVEINYSRKFLRFYRPDGYEHRPNKNQETLPLHVVNKKAYVDGMVYLQDETQVPVKLLVDSGSSDAIWLFESDSIAIPDKHYPDFLGKGLNGDVFGKRSMVKGIQIGSFLLKDAKTAFPDMVHYEEILDMGGRNGSMGGEVLKRFNMVFDYPNGSVTLQKNGNFNTPFQYNMSGIEIRHNGVRYISERITNRKTNPIEKTRENLGNVQILFERQTRLSLVPEIVVSGIRADSPAKDAGLQEGDVILAVNGKKVYSYKLQEIMHLLNEREGKRVRLLIERSDGDKLITYELKNMFKEKP